MHGVLPDILTLLALALGVAWIFRLLRAPAILGFLGAGILAGPSGLNIIGHEHIDDFAEFGLVLLLFTVGLELAPEALTRNARSIVIAASAQILGTTALMAAIAWGVARLAAAPLSPVSAAVLGLAAALSSTAMALKHFSDRRETATPAGALSTGVLLVQDVCVILAIVLLPAFSRQGDASLAEGLARSLGSLIVLVFVFALGLKITPWLLRTALRQGGQELLTLFALVGAMAGAWAAGLAGWSPALGACLVGLLFARTDLQHQLRAEVTPFRDVFNAVFFLSIGMLVDLGSLREHAAALAGAVVLTVLAKALIAGGSVVLAGWPLRVAAVVGVGLCSLSEFGYVLAREADRLDLLPDGLLPLVVAWIVGAMILNALLLPWANQTAAALDRLWKPSASPAPGGVPPDAAPAGHVIIVGFGLNGRNLAQALRAVGSPFTVIEMNRGLAQQAREVGGHALVGDAARLAILEEAGLAHARALVVCAGDQDAARRIVAQARSARPDVYILARTRFVAELDRLYRLGASFVIPEEFETSIELFAHLLKEFGIPQNVIEQQITMARAGRYGMLRGRALDSGLQHEWARLLEAAVTQTFQIEPGSAGCDGTIRALNLRARTGATIVSVTRHGKAYPNPSPDLALETADVLVLVGTHRQLMEAKRALAPPTPDPQAGMGA